MRALSMLLALAFLAGCASKSTESLSNASYQIGVEQVAVLGVPFLTDEQGSVVHSKQWQGVAFGGMHHSYTKSDDYRLTELYYGGISDGQALVIAQETLGNSTTPKRRPYSLPLSQTDTFQVGRYTLQILSASAGSMRFKVLND